MSLTARIFGVAPQQPHRIGVRRDVVVPAADGVPLLATHFYPIGVERPPLVLLRSPYGRGTALDKMPELLAERGYQVLYQSLRGTSGSGGDFDGFVIDPADGDGTLSWLRDQPWFGGSLATWGASYLGYAQWELAARDIPEWKIAVIQDAPSEFAHQFMYPGGAFALGNALGWVQIADRMFRADGGLARQFLGAVTGSRQLRRAALTLPIADADLALTGRHIPWFQDWIRHGPDDPYWMSTDHRANVERLPPVVYLQGGWYDFFLPGMLADYAAIVASGRKVRLLIGPWSHGRGGYTRTGLRDALAALDKALDPALANEDPTTGVRVQVTGSRRWIDLAGWPPAAGDTPWYLQPGGGLVRRTAPEAAPISRFRYDPADPTPTVAGTAVGLIAGPGANRRIESRPDVLTFTSARLDSDLDVIGPTRVRLYASSSTPSYDFFARLCDVTPKGRSHNISDGIVRVTRTPCPHPDATGSVEELDIELWPIAHTFRRGHRIRLQISGGAHPRFGRNPGTGEPLATGRALRTSERTIHHDGAHPSALWLSTTDPRRRLDADERHALCDLFAQLGPDAPTLLDDWTAKDLAAHIVLREHDSLAGPCLVLPGRFGRFAERRRVRLAEQSTFECLVEQIRSGPPRGFFSIGWVRSMANLNEFFVHHEDVRRANGLGPREDLGPELEAALWHNVCRGNRFLSRRLHGVGLEICWAGTDERIAARKTGPAARLSGRPGEVLLYLFGRQDAARVELTGPAEAVATVRRTQFGM